MKVGVLLPTFRDGARDALAAAEQAASGGLDGVFAYDHLWPMGSPQRPSLAPFPVLAAVAARHPQLVVGPLVARVGVTSTAHLVRQFRSLAAVAPGRVIGALGTGDALSRAENDAYGIAWQSADERRELVREAALALGGEMEVWIGAGAPATNELARALGATLNVWDKSPDEVAQLAASGPVTWAGPGPDDLAATLDALALAGASWAVLSPQVAIEDVAEWRRAN